MSIRRGIDWLMLQTAKGLLASRMALTDPTQTEGNCSNTFPLVDIVPPGAKRNGKIERCGTSHQKRWAKSVLAIGSVICFGKLAIFRTYDLSPRRDYTHHATSQFILLG